MNTIARWMKRNGAAAVAVVVLSLLGLMAGVVISFMACVIVGHFQPDRFVTSYEVDHEPHPPH